MERNPRGDSDPTTGAAPDDRDWEQALAHRRREPPETVAAVVERFRAAGVTPAEVRAHLVDGGDRLYRAARSGAEDWADQFGGPRAAAVLAAEVGALMSHLVARAASVRSVCVDALLDELSAVTVAGALGVARQKVYDLAKPDLDPDHLTSCPWRTE